MSLISKLLLQHISIPQLVGFILANLTGMFIVMLGYQFYCDIIPIFNQSDSFISQDYLILSKRIGPAASLSPNAQNFDEEEIQQLAKQHFVQDIAAFQTRQYIAEAQIAIQGKNILNSEIPLESLPDNFVDCPLQHWKYTQGSNVVPIIIPRTYLNMYNFGFAQARALPTIGDATLSLIQININIHGNGQRQSFQAKVVGVSNRINAILVPQQFMTFTNQKFAPNEKNQPNRLVIKTTQHPDQPIEPYLQQYGYQIQDQQLQNQKTTLFLQILLSTVITIGLIISLLSFIILILSIFLLVQKNQNKLQTLLLIGYTPQSVAKPYQLLTLTLNAIVYIAAIAAIAYLRSQYIHTITALSPTNNQNNILPAALLGLLLLTIVTLINSAVIQRKVNSISKNKP